MTLGLSCLRRRQDSGQLSSEGNLVVEGDVKMEEEYTLRFYIAAARENRMHLLVCSVFDQTLNAYRVLGAV